MRKTKSSPAHAAAARANGAKSKGPKTAPGKQRSSQNSIKHLCSSRKAAVLLPGEDVTKLQAYTNAYYLHFRPKDIAEASIIDQLITQMWRSLRIVGYESEILTSTAEDLHPTLADDYQSIALTRLFALAFNNTPEKSANPLANRYMVAARNMFRSALCDLERVRRLAGDPDSPFVEPPQISAPDASLCIDLSILPVPDAESVIIPLAPESPDTEPRPWPESVPEFGSESDSAPQPEPEPAIPPPQPDPEPQPEFTPMHDARGVVKTLTGTPVMISKSQLGPTATQTFACSSASK